jgi:hypothetical protein
MRIASRQKGSFGEIIPGKQRGQNPGEAPGIQCLPSRADSYVPPASSGRLVSWRECAESGRKLPLPKRDGCANLRETGAGAFC